MCETMRPAATGFRQPPSAVQDGAGFADLLRLNPLFEPLRDHQIAPLVALARDAQFPADAVICRQGELPRHLHLLTDGQVALWATASDGTHAVVEVIQPPGYFVLASVLTRLPYLTTARAICASRMILIEAEGLHALLDGGGALANVLLRAQALSFRSLLRQVEDLKMRTAAQRLGCYLLALAGDTTAAVAHFRLPFDKGLLAARLGCRQENLSRAFATLRNSGVETHGSRVILHDIPTLRTYAVPSENTDPGLQFSG